MSLQKGQIVFFLETYVGSPLKAIVEKLHSWAMSTVFVLKQTHSLLVTAQLCNIIFIYKASFLQGIENT